MSSTQSEALWITGPGRVEIRSRQRPRAGSSEVMVAALYSGISRGSERLVFEGRVPESQYDAMRAPFQDGEFPGPVKYGYSLVGRVVEGKGDFVGQTVFVLNPHERHCVVPEAAVVPVPEAVPAERAVLTANMETALNAFWDSGAGPGDRIAVIGAGVVGCLVAYLLNRLPGAEVLAADIDEKKRRIVNALGVEFRLPSEIPKDCDLVIHASASPEGLASALDAAGYEATILELSWYGDTPVPVALGESFHAKRLTLKSSQVGGVPPHRAPRWSHRRRLETAIGLLADPALDALISGETAFADLPHMYGAILSAPDTLCHRIVY